MNLQHILALLSSLTLISCVAPAPPSGFLKQREPTERDHATLFQRSWKNPKVDFSKYQRVHVSPTNITHTKVSNRRFNERNFFKKSYQTDIHQNAVHLQNTFEKAFANSTKRSWKTVKQASRDGQTLLVETALLEIAPSRPTLEAINTVVRGASAFNNPVTTIEVKVSDARSGEILASFADRDAPPWAGLDLAKVRFYKAQRKVMDRWGQQTVRWLNGNEPNPLLDKLPIRLITW